MAVEGPRTLCIGRNVDVDGRARLDVNRVLFRVACAIAHLWQKPGAVDMHRVIHHGFIDEPEANPLAVAQDDRLRLAELAPVDRPEVALHVSGQTDLDDTVVALVRIGIERLKIAIGEHSGAGRRAGIVSQRVRGHVDRGDRHAGHILAAAQSISLRSSLDCSRLHRCWRHPGSCGRAM